MSRRGGDRIGLHKDPRTGHYIWRGVHPLTKQRVKRSTKTGRLDRAVRMIEGFKADLEAEANGARGLRRLGDQVGPYIDEFVKSIDGGDRWRTHILISLKRAFSLLRVTHMRDLLDGGRIMRAIESRVGEGPEELKDRTAVRCYQEPMKRFTAFHARRGNLPFDSLSTWDRIKVRSVTRGRRAMAPGDVARALAASEWLDALHRRQHPTGIVWKALLISAARIGAFSELQVGDFDRQKRWLDLQGNKIKRAGAGMLDEATAEEISAYVGNREEGPLFLSPQGSGLISTSVIDDWREAFALGCVRAEWPQDEGQDEMLKYCVSRTLLTDKVFASRGGPRSGRHKPGPKKAEQRSSREKCIERIADAIRSGWTKRMYLVDIHCFRITHRSWSLADGVPEFRIDLQLGHSAPQQSSVSHEGPRLVSGVGRRHYTDLEFLRETAGHSAEAVRRTLDQAIARLEKITPSNTDDGSSAASYA